MLQSNETIILHLATFWTKMFPIHVQAGPRAVMFPQWSTFNSCRKIDPFFSDERKVIKWCNLIDTATSHFLGLLTVSTLNTETYLLASQNGWCCSFHYLPKRKNSVQSSYSIHQEPCNVIDKIPSWTRKMVATCTGFEELFAALVLFTNQSF